MRTFGIAYTDRSGINIMLAPRRFEVGGVAALTFIRNVRHNLFSTCTFPYFRALFNPFPVRFGRQLLLIRDITSRSRHLSLFSIFSYEEAEQNP